MLKKFIFTLLISLSILTCTISVNAREINSVSSISSIHDYILVAEDENDQTALAEDDGASPSERCKSILGNPEDPNSTAWLIQEILGYIRIVGVMLVLALSSFDFTRAIIQNDEKFMQNVKSHLLTRALALVLLFFIPSIVYALLTAFGVYSSCSETVFDLSFIKLLVGLKV